MMKPVHGPLWKDGLTPKKKRARRTRRLSAEEHAAKQVVRDRDEHCRFPLCGCGEWKRVPAAKRVLTVSHDVHKGMGGDPTGTVSVPALMIALCKWRHQDAPVSRHRGTMRTRYLTADQNDGPVAFEVDLHAVYPGLYDHAGIWFEVARETHVEGGSGTLRLEMLTYEQERVLTDLREMAR